MVSGRTCSITSNLQMEVDPEHILKEHVEYRSAVDQGAIADPNKLEDDVNYNNNGNDDVAKDGFDDAHGIMLSVSEILVQSAQSVKDFVSGNGFHSSEDGDSEEKSLLQSVGEKIAQSAQSVKDAVNSGLENDDGEEKSLLQSVSDKIVQSARNVKDGVNGHGDHLLTDADGTGESTILVHSVLD